MKHKADLCTTPAPHLVNKLPDVLLPQVVHHVLGKKKAVRHSPVQHTTISHKKRRRQSEDIDFKHLWALLAALPSQRTQTPQQRTQLPKGPSRWEAHPESSDVPGAGVTTITVPPPTVILCVI